jgi:predicted O-methyltransferase YrrM
MNKYPEQEKRYNEIVSKYGLSRGLHLGDLTILLNYLEKLESNSNYVEIGVSNGSSIITSALFRPDINCYGIEIENDTIATKIITDLDIKNIELYLGRGAEEVCKKWNKEIDLLFIDGEHLFPNIFWDFVGWYPYVKKNGKILFHDFEKSKESKFEVGKALEVMKGHPKYKIYIPLIEDIYNSSIAILTK